MNTDSRLLRDTGETNIEVAPTLMGADSMEIPAEVVLATNAAQLQPGEPVGEYEIEHALGQGGMGTVYSARHPVIGKRVAVKVLNRRQSADAESVKRFVNEARAVNQIGHKNIVDVFALGRLPDGRAYMVMELLRGDTLAARMAQGPLPMGEAANYLAQICRALSAAHQADVIHRDLKPDNVFLAQHSDHNRIVKLLDFGIAKLVGEEHFGMFRTQTGTMLGTPAYVSPEQAKGKNVGQASDVYSLAVMAYEMLCGRRPFIAESGMEVVAMHLHDAPVPPIEVAPHLPQYMSDAIVRALSKDPSERPTLDELRLIFTGATPHMVAQGGPELSNATMQVPRMGGFRTAWIAATGAAAVVVMIGVFMLVRGDGDAKGSAEAGSSGDVAAAAADPPSSGQADGVPATTPDPDAPEPVGHITVEINVPDAQIAVNGKVFRAEGKTTKLPVYRTGAHTVVVWADAYAPTSQSIEVADGQTAAVRFLLTNDTDKAVAPKTEVRSDKGNKARRSKKKKKKKKKRRKRKEGADDRIDPFAD